MYTDQNTELRNSSAIMCVFYCVACCFSCSFLLRLSGISGGGGRGRRNITFTES